MRVSVTTIHEVGNEGMRKSSLRFCRVRLALLRLLLLGIVGNAIGGLSIRAEEDEATFFEKRIRPVLVVECQDCHGSEVQESGLRVDDRDALRKGGDRGVAVMPGKPDESLLYLTMAHRHPTLRMPENRPQLSDRIIEDFRRWIETGAYDPRTEPSDLNTESVWDSVFELRRAAAWSLAPVSKPPLPEVQSPDWCASAVDCFVLERLEREGLKPTVDATPEVWLRRVSFVLTGLPPEESEVQEFLADARPDARTRVLDRKLASIDLGERWARHWMDLVRYAESYGHEQDFEIAQAWRYRDYLVRGFDADVPYDRFVIEHIAGDQIESPRLDPTGNYDESIVGTGWWFLHQATHAPVDPVQDEHDRIDNQIDVLSKTFLGLTMACTRCHDHKFDPISMQDYYGLVAYLKASRQQMTYLDRDGSLSFRVAAAERRRNATRNWLAPLVGAEEAYPATRLDDYVFVAAESDPQQREQLVKERGLDLACAERWRATLEEARSAQGPHPLRPFVSEQPKPLAPGNLARPDASEVRQEVVSWLPEHWFATGPAFQGWPELAESPRWRPREESVEILASDVLHSGLLDEALPGVLRSPSFTISQDHLHLRVAGVKGRLKLVIARYQLRDVNPLLFGETIMEVDSGGEFQWRSMHSDLRRYRGLDAYLELIDEGEGFIAIDRLVLSDRPEPPREVLEFEDREHDDSFEEAAPSERLEREVRAGWRAWREGRVTAEMKLVGDLSRRGLLEGLRLDNAPAECRASLPPFAPPDRALAIAQGSPETTRRLERGNHRMPAEVVPPQVPRALGLDPALSESEQPSRRMLAQALVDPDNPLVHRVMVNRIWAHAFGEGLVATRDDFGAMGRAPSHPELLDHLVMVFRRDGTSVKGMLRRLLSSRSFGLSSRNEDYQANAIDPEGVLLHRHRMRRLEGEAVRDAILAASGSLSRQRFGPSVLTHLTPYMGDPHWLSGRGIGSGPLDGDRRRSVYVETRRNFLSPWMVAFDLPIPDSTVGRRNVSNVPAQALALTNDPFVLQESARYAELLLADATLTVEQRLERLYLRSLGRQPLESELEVWREFLRQREVGDSSVEPRRDNELETWTELCHVVFMLKEFFHVE